MKTRAITGFFFVIIMLGSLFLGPWVFAGFFLLLATASLFEYHQLLAIASRGGDAEETASNSSGLAVALKSSAISGTLLGAGIFALLIAINQSLLAEKWIGLLVLVLPLLFLVQLFQQNELPFVRVANTALGFFYVIIPFYCFYQLGFRFGEYQAVLPLSFLLLLWANDTGAYLIGRAFGRNKLFERVSPKKTWEGFFGGWLSALLVGVILFNQQIHIMNLTHWLVFASIIAVIGTLGDLVESALKRSLKVKDSGHILPGHGGLLDRFDGLLLAAPFCYIYFLIVFG